MAFQCKMCGECCSNLRGRLGDFVPPPLLPFLFTVAPNSLKTFAVFEWEVPILQREAKKLSIECMIKPDFILWDKNSDTPFVIQWNLDHDNCPFLSEQNKCLINPDKPLTCRTFPLIIEGLFDKVNAPIGSAVPLHIELGDCPNIYLPPPKNREKILKPGEVYQELYRLYDNTFLGAVQFNAATKMQGTGLRELIEEKIIRPATINKKIIKLILRSKKVGLQEYLSRHYPQIAEEYNESIKSIYEFDSATLERMIAGINN